MKVLDIDDATSDDMRGYKLIESDRQIGWFNCSLRHRLLKRIILSKRPLSKTRLFLMSIGKLTVELYNYHSMLSFHRSEYIYGLHFLFLRLKWARY